VTILEERIAAELRATFAQSGISAKLKTRRLSSAVDDGAAVFTVGDKHMAAILLVSPPQFPDVVSHEHEKAAKMKRHLGPELGSTILAPLALGKYMGRSYALMPLKKQLSDNRLLWALQRRAIKPSVIAWLRQVQSATKVTESSFDNYQLALESLAELEGLDEAIKSVANLTLRRLLAGKLSPLSTPMHNDLWKGNILLRSADDRGNKFPFFVIDWRGSRVDGFPFFDLIRLSMSLRLDRSALRAEIEQVCEILKCQFDDAQGYVAAALGEISLRRDRFPRTAFLEMANRCFEQLRHAGR
jgi:hypothetical protein